MQINKYLGILCWCIVLGYTSGWAQVPHAQGEIQIINAGVGGNTSGDLIKRLEADVLQKDPDLVLIMVGTNDMVNSAKLTSYVDYKAHMVTLIRRLKREGVQPVLMSPPPVDTAYLFQRHDRSKFDVPPNEKLAEVSKILKTLARQEKLVFIDLQRAFVKAEVPKHNQDTWIKNMLNSGEADGVHPTPEGYTFIGKYVYDALEKHGVFLKGYKTILCFGDSITYGSRVCGAGTAEGQTYPAVLERLIKQSGQLRK